MAYSSQIFTGPWKHRLLARKLIWALGCRVCRPPVGPWVKVQPRLSRSWVWSSDGPWIRRDCPESLEIKFRWLTQAPKGESNNQF